ncbi:MAG: Hpt domain-containing protein [Treponema sp.]|jgi:HPt (histidine-containing phosphotransfer) domain-containing protein|nr:Hpt domain-containing protein [Treponema sp.]
MADGVVYVDAAEGQKRVMNNAKLYHRLLAKFRAENNLNELVAAVNAGEYEKAQAAAHTIKGIAANLSLSELYKQSLAVETQIKAKAVEPGAMETLSACFVSTLEAIDKVLVQDA